MKMRLIGCIAVFGLLFCSLGVKAQSDYRAEIGFHSGVSSYVGDANSILFNHAQPDYGAVFRYNFNERFLLQTEFNNTVVTDGVFKNTLNSVDVCGEFNFFDFNYKIFKPESHKYSTYLMTGVGLMSYDYQGNSKLMYSYIIGVGFKVRLIDRVKLNIQWSNKLLLTDQMEGIAAYNNPAGLNGTNLFNNDLLSVLTVGFTFDILKENCKCLSFNK